MTWIHKSRNPNSATKDWYVIDESLVYGWLVLQHGKWWASLTYGSDNRDELVYNKGFDTKEEAMSAVEQRLASMAQDLLSDALGVRRIQEAKHES